MHTGVCVFRSVCLAAVLSLALTACDRDETDEQATREQVSLEQLPPPVKEAVLAGRKGATVLGIERVGPPGTAVYEANLVASGKMRQLRLDEKGQVLPPLSSKDDDD